MRTTLLTLAVAALAAAGSAAAQERAASPEPRSSSAREIEGLSIPRNADGTIDSAALAAEIDRQFAAGATEIQFRGSPLSAQEARALLLDGSLLSELAAHLPNDGIERSVRLRGGVEARVQRNEEGRLRARVEQVDLSGLTADQRAALARELAAEGGFERLRIRGVDANGERVRVEFRDGRDIVKNEGRGERGDDARGERLAGLDDDSRGRGRGGERAERAERRERAERPERRERVERPERSDRSGRH